LRGRPADSLFDIPFLIARSRAILPALDVEAGGLKEAIMISETALATGAGDCPERGRNAPMVEP